MSARLIWRASFPLCISSRAKLVTRSFMSCLSMMQGENLFQKPAGVGAGGLCYFLRGPRRSQVTTTFPGFGADVYNVVGGLDNIQVVLDYHYGVAGVHELVQTVQELLDICQVEAGGGFVQDVEVMGAFFLFAEFGGQLDASPPERVLEDWPSLI